MSDTVHTDLAALARAYDVFFVDQFGVLRDDVGPYDGAISALSQLAALKKQIVILSNSGRSGQYNAERLIKLGFAPTSFQHFITSGDVAFETLSRAQWSVAKHGRCFTVSSGGDRNLADRLGLVSIDTARDADVIIISGSEAERIPMEEYREMLRPAAESRAPCYCTNPDIHKLHEGRVAPGAGSIARLYEEMGGKVAWLGKPFPEIYRHALRVAGVEDPRRVVCIGDSIEHDILGANTAGLASVLVRTGILADKDEKELARLSEQSSAHANYVLDRFCF
ncbi:TIGR01459 family HAD-type hydrolase [Rhizobium metallidurans]|uniref:HAD superfamily hydrolase (TIGR01459 family) n=1 Tax=Rhizobium metallidurans TaxID=1265931 RepID=A0A7W6CK45_9HYPH|nr:TIGR01459 family HAD-type hydrolase [Rhizobium metallidurans]MBB3962505.1 HAD superfamily hydrolase (TIGR01459 family) [Rhizobium metallidurans]